MFWLSFRGERVVFRVLVLLVFFLWLVVLWCRLARSHHSLIPSLTHLLPYSLTHLLTILLHFLLAFVLLCPALFDTELDQLQRVNMSDLTEKEKLMSECMSDTVSNECKTTEHKVSFVKPSKKSCPTRYLFVSKANTSLPIDILTQELIDIFSPFGPLDQSIPGTTSVGPVVINQKRHVCYVCFASKESCERALLATQAGQGLVLPSNNTVRLICKYADVERPVIPPPEPECISSTTEINVPGLTVIENFITSEEEQYLLDFCDNRNAEKFFSKGNIYYEYLLLLLKVVFVLCFALFLY